MATPPIDAPRSADNSCPMPIPFVQIDSFTSAPFTGNPAAVCLLDAPTDDAWMQRVAAEMNLAETAFVRPGEGEYALRWFTPTIEVDLCGHATLAAAHALWELGQTDAQTLRFATRSGILTAERVDGRIRLDFPAEPAVAADPAPGLMEALGTNGAHVGRNRLDHLVVVETEDEVRAIAPDFRRLAKAVTRGVMVTARSAEEHDFVSRFFAPAAGIDEDPVTGSAHCCLGPYWSERLGRRELVGYQASARGGIVRVAVRGERVYLDGEAVTVLRGEVVV